MFKEIKRLPFPLAGRMRPHEYSMDELRALCDQADTGDWAFFPARLVLEALFIAAVGATYSPEYDSRTGNRRGTRVSVLSYQVWWDRGWKSVWETPWNITRHRDAIWGHDGESLGLGGGYRNDETLANPGQLPIDVLAMCAAQRGLKFSLQAPETPLCNYEVCFGGTSWAAGSPALAALCAVIAHAMALGAEGSIWGEERAAGCPSSSGEVGS